MKLTILSYKKVQLEYELPIYMVGESKVKVETVKATIIYQQDTLKIRAAKRTLNKNKKYYRLMERGVDRIIQDTGFRNKVGKPDKTGKDFDRISPWYKNNVTIEGFELDKVLQEVHVSDSKYLSEFRDRKLSSLV